MRDSFILYTKYKKNIKSLSLEQKGKLLDLIFTYEENDHEEVPEIDDPILDIVFGFIQDDLDSNYERYQSAVSNGKKGGRPKQNEGLEDKKGTKPTLNDPLLEEKGTKPTLNDPFEPNNLNDNDNVNDNDNDNVKEKNNKKETFVSVVDDYTSNKELKSFLMSFVDMRKKMKGFTTEALKLNLSALDKLARDDITKIEIIKQSIANSWKSFYELKNKQCTYEQPPNKNVFGDDLAF